jgi:tungstate transport system substrate-binding protein
MRIAMVSEGVPARRRSFTRERLVPRSWSSLLCLGLLLLQSCRARAPLESEPPSLRVATSHSLEQSGLFAALSTAYERQTNQRVQPSFVGSGEALKMGRAGTVDVVFVHARPLEDAFIAEGYGINRRDVMYSEYVIVGPPSDPVTIGGLSSAVEALVRLSRARALFLSRGDDSGNHTRELDLWKLSHVEPDGPWYQRVGAGMLETLERASQLGAYVLADRPTYIVNESRLNLKVLVRGDTRLHNPYGVIAVNPMRVPGANYAGAISFIDFISSAPAQIIIAEFGRAEYGTPLFSPSGNTQDGD